MKKIISLILSLSLLLCMAGCTGNNEAEEKEKKKGKREIKAENLLEDVSPNEIEANEDLSYLSEDVTDFAIRLFKESEESGKNTLISPLSVLCALAMTANGAEEETLSQMEDVLGLTVEELNLYIYSYMKNLPQDEKNKLNLANSIWFTDEESFEVNQDFLQNTADYYGADIYKAPFNKDTCDDINSWVKEKTDKMIPEILDNISEDAVMYLVNALAFEAEWDEVYDKGSVREGTFTKEDGTKQDVDFMHGEERIYLEDDYAVGFKKYYNNRNYAFVAMLPDEDVSISEYVASLDGESVNELLTNYDYTDVRIKIPKFETEYEVEMSDILKAMGMTDAFDENVAEFGKIGTSGDNIIYISRVLHKTFISVGEKGTKAGAATVVEVSLEGAADETPEEPKRVELDRPFVYMLVDCENNIPFFIGTVMEIEK